MLISADTCSELLAGWKQAGGTLNHPLGLPPPKPCSLISTSLLLSLLDGKRKMERESCGHTVVSSKNTKETQSPYSLMKEWGSAKQPGKHIQGIAKKPEGSKAHDGQPSERTPSVICCVSTPFCCVHARWQLENQQ